MRREILLASLGYSSTMLDTCRTPIQVDGHLDPSSFMHDHSVRLFPALARTLHATACQSSLRPTKRGCSRGPDINGDRIDPAPLPLWLHSNTHFVLILYCVDLIYRGHWPHGRALIECCRAQGAMSAEKSRATPRRSPPLRRQCARPTGCARAATRTPPAAAPRRRRCSHQRSALCLESSREGRALLS
jgi:hypothetical protein